MSSLSLFEVDSPTITEQHIRIIMQLCVIDLGDSHTELVGKSHKLAQTDPEEAATLIADHSHASIAGENDNVQSIREWILHHLHNPHDLPRPLAIPTINDCIRLADPDTEAGRALGWLLGLYPDPEKVSNTQPPSPTRLGGLKDDDGESWVWITPQTTEVCVRTAKHPWAKKAVTNVEASPQQMVELARYMLMNTTKEKPQ